LLRQIVDHDDDAIHLLRKCAKNPVEDWSALDRQQRLWNVQCVRPQARTKPGRKDDCIHFLRLASVSAFNSSPCFAPSPSQPEARQIRLPRPGFGAVSNERATRQESMVT